MLLAIRPDGKRRERVVSWQSYLQAAFDKNLVDVDDDTVEFLAATGHAVDRGRVETDLLEALDFIDGALWCDQKAADLGLTQLTLAATSAGQRTSVRLNVNGVEDPLHDPRIPTLIVAVRQYRSTDAVALYGADHDWRVVVSTGDPLAFKANLEAPLLESSPLEADTVRELAAAHGILADLFSVGRGSTR